MKENLFKKAFRILMEAFQNCLKRFPVTVGFIIVLTAYILFLVTEGVNKDDRLLQILGYYLSIGSLLSLTLHLWGEETAHSTRKMIVYVVMNVLLIADAIYLYNLSPDQSLTEIGIAHGAGVLALGISIFFLSFTKEKNDIASWNFASYALGTFVIVNIIGYIMSGGISLLILSLDILFDIDVNNNYYLYVFALCTVPLPSLLFLGMLPKDGKKHNRQPQSSEFLNGIIHFLFLPLIAGYLIVLYFYAIRILVDWELPMGWVSWLVVALMAGCIAIEFGLYPARIKEAKRTDEWITRWLPALILPLLLLMTVGIIRRFNDYGITINRLYLITLNAWFYIVCIGLFVIKARRISWIPISFAVLFLLTSVLPVNYASITRNAIRSGIEAEIKQKGDLELPLTNITYKDWLTSLPKEKAAQLNDKFMYLDNWFGWGSISDWVAKDVSFYNAQYEFGPDAEEFEPKLSYNGQANDTIPIKIPKGYSQFVKISNSSNLPSRYLETGILPVFMDTQTESSSDNTVDIDLKTLEKLNETKYNEMEPMLFKCNSGKHLFILTRFSLMYNKQDNKEIHLSVDGYLFKN